MSKTLFTPWLAGLAVLAALALLPAATAEAGGGISLNSGNTVKGKKAKLRKGRAIPPAAAPKRIQKVIRAANKIRNKPYKWGGGHGRWRDNGYDCSGAVSFALHGGKLLARPRASGDLANWRKRGKGKWLTVYANGGHAYMVVAGLRFDTSMTPGNGPGWSRDMRSTPGKFAKRHVPGL